MPFRIDRAQFDPDKIREDSQGFLRVWGTVAKPGPLTYRMDSGEHTELVLPETLADPEWQVSLSDQILTEEHPSIPVNSKNADSYAVGNSNDVIFDNGFQRVALTVRNEDSKRKALNGELDELSPGYKTETIRKDSLPAEVVEELQKEWGEFDAVQTKRDCNHIALTKAARAGPDTSLHLDSLGADVGVQTDSTPDTAPQLPVAAPKHSFDKSEALKRLTKFYGFDPTAGDDVPEPFSDNWVVFPDIQGKGFNDISNFWGLFTDIVNGKRQIVPEAVQALEKKFRRTDFSKFGEDPEEVKSVISALWSKVWGEFEDKALPRPEPEFPNSDSYHSEEEREDADSLRTVLRGLVAPLDAKEAEIVGQVAQLTGMNESGVWGYLTGRVDKNPDLKVIQAFAEVLGTNAEEILRGAGLEQRISELKQQTEDSTMGTNRRKKTRKDGDEMRKDQQGEGEGETFQEYLPEKFTDLPDVSEMNLEQLKTTADEMRKTVKAIKQKKKDLNQKLKDMGIRIMGEQETAERGSQPGSEGSPQQTSDGMKNRERGDSEDSETEGKRMDSEEEWTQFLAERDRIKEVADELGVTVDNGMRNDSMKQKVAEEFTGEDLSGVDQKQIEGMFQVAENRAGTINYDRAQKAASQRADSQKSEDSRDSGMSEEEARKKHEEWFANGGTGTDE